MKKLIQTFFLLGLGLGFLGVQTQAAEGLLVGVVNIQKIMNSINEGKSITQKLKKEFDKKQAEIKKEEAKLKEREANKALLSEAGKRKFNEDIMKLQQKTMRYQREIQKKEATLKKPILEKIKKVIDEVSKSKKVAFTIEQTTSSIVYAAKTVNISDEVIKSYNKKHKK